MFKQRAWVIPVNIAALFGFLSALAKQNQDPVWMYIDGGMALVSLAFAYRWYRLGRRPPAP